MSALLGSLSCTYCTLASRAVLGPEVKLRANPNVSNEQHQATRAANGRLSHDLCAQAAGPALISNGGWCARTTQNSELFVFARARANSAIQFHPTFQGITEESTS